MRSSFSLIVSSQLLHHVLATAPSSVRSRVPEACGKTDSLEVFVVFKQ
jgi:hypothetical protein